MRLLVAFWSLNHLPSAWAKLVFCSQEEIATLNRVGAKQYLSKNRLSLDWSTVSYVALLQRWASPTSRLDLFTELRNQLYPRSKRSGCHYGSIMGLHREAIYWSWALRWLRGQREARCVLPKWSPWHGYDLPDMGTQLMEKTFSENHSVSLLAQSWEEKDRSFTAFIKGEDAALRCITWSSLGGYLLLLLTTRKKYLPSKS